MGHYTITLPDGRPGDVRYGLVQKKSFFLNLFSKNKPDETKTGYVVIIGSDKATKKKYWLFKSQDGKWSQDAEGLKALDNDLYLNIRNAINEKEKAKFG